MTTHRYPKYPRKQYGTESSETLFSTPSKSTIIQILHATIDDLRLLQQTIHELLKREDQSREERRHLEMTLQYAQDAERQAQQDMKDVDQRKQERRSDKQPNAYERRQNERRAP